MTCGGDSRSGGKSRCVHCLKRTTRRLESSSPFFFPSLLSPFFFPCSKLPKKIQADDLDAVQEQLDDLGITWVRETVVEGGVLVTQVRLEVFFLLLFRLSVDTPGFSLFSFSPCFFPPSQKTKTIRFSCTTRTTTWSRSATAASSPSCPCRKGGLLCRNGPRSTWASTRARRRRRGSCPAAPRRCRRRALLLIPRRR